MCKKNGESIDHLLLHCGEARIVWNYFYSLFGHAKKRARFFEWLGHLAGSWSCYATLEASSLVCYVRSLA
jgi:hypothetical protein